MSKPRILFTIALDGRNSWREQTAVRRVQAIGKKTTVSMPSDVVSEILSAGQRLRVAVTFDEVYDTPSPETLWAARAAIVALAPPDLRELFNEARRMATWEERRDYEQRLVVIALERVVIVPTAWEGDRALCPFCGDYPSAPGPREGFAYPNGLVMHLEGKGNARQCDVVRALMDWGRYQ